MPLVLSVSARLPASIQTPTVDVCAHGEWSVAIYLRVSQIQFDLIRGKYREAIAESRALCFCAVANGGSEGPGDGLDGLQGSLVAQAPLVVQGEPPRSS